jgi:hypothetical protein
MTTKEGLKLLVGLFAPLTITSVYAEPVLTAVGAVAQLYLAKITGTAFQAGSADVAKETEALKGLITTSTENRVTRALLGTVHVLAALRMSQRGQAELNDHGDAMTPTGGATQALNFAGILILCVMAGIWFSSGYYGQ